MPTPANPIPAPRVLELAATSWYRASSRRRMPSPSSTMVSAGAVVERGGVMVGVVLWNEEDGALYISRLSVNPEHRRQGIARALIDAAEREARRQGLPRMTLGVRLELEENRRLFRSCGFEETTFRSHEGFSEPTWVMMERRLPEAPR